MIARHVYVHVPFCARRCAYCDFAIAVRRTTPVADFVTALEGEILARFPADAPVEVDTLYLGGGTPSRLGVDGVERVLEVLRRRWIPAADAEVTLEANPEDVDATTAVAWRRAGITRLSLGIQSFDDRVLAWMHRSHDSARAVEAVEALRSAGFGDWSLDLIFALPAGIEREWRRDLELAMALDPPHLSCYGLTLEPRTPLMRWRERGLVRERDETGYEAEFLEAHETLSAAGYDHYEVSNYARPGRMARHNSAYWRRVPYAGLGPSAHGFDGATRRWNEREFAAWYQRASRREDPIAGAEALTAEQVRLEETYLGLRTTFGVRTGEADRQITEPWLARGWAQMSGDRLRLTAAGWLRLDALVGALTDVRSRL